MIRLTFDQAFPYYRWGSVARPLLHVILRANQKETSTWALFDSGADSCTFHEQFAKDLDIDIYTGTPHLMDGAVGSASTMVWTHSVDMTIENLHFGQVPVDFASDFGEEFSDQLIGRDGIFDRVAVGFRHAQQRIFLTLP